MIKNLSDPYIFLWINELLLQKTRCGSRQEDIEGLFSASLFDFVFATSDYAKSS
jgi:hypothetical protein